MNLGARKGGFARSVAVGLSFLAFSAFARSAKASPEDIFGYGTRTSAMGGTGTAHSGGYEAAWHNPALASVVKAPRLTLGLLGAIFRLDARGDGLPGRTSTPAAKGAIIGAELPIPFGGILSRRLGFSFGFYEPTDVVVRGRVLYPEKTQFPILDNRAQSVTVRAAIGADIGRGVRLGVGFAALAEVVGSVVAATDATGRVGTRVEDQLVATYAPAFGATYDLPLGRPETWRVGATYRGSLAARFAVVIDGSKLTSLQIPLFNISGLAQYDPAQLAVEVARIDKANVLALQFVYKRWSDYPGTIEPTLVCSDASSSACGLVPPRIDWRDTVVVRLGMERSTQLADGATFHLRGGAFYEMSPMPRDVPGSFAYDRAAQGLVPVPTRYFDSDRLAITLGFGLAMSKPLPPIEIDWFAQQHYLSRRTIRSVDPDSSERVLSEGEVSGHVWAFGTTAGVHF